MQFLVGRSRIGQFPNVGIFYVFKLYQINLLRKVKTNRLDL